MTTIKFVSSDDHAPTERLALLVSLSQITNQEGGSDLDALYTQALMEEFLCVDPSSLNSHGQKAYRHRWTVVGAVLLVFNPLSIGNLTDLLTNLCTPSSVSAILCSFDPLFLNLGGVEDPICTFDRSFSDFLMDPKRRMDNWFFVEPSVHHADLLLSCLNLMKERLERNICNLNDYATLSRVGDISTCREKRMGGALEYACQFWTKHLMEVSTCGHNVREVCKAIDVFFTTYLLFWIEALIIMESPDTIVHAMNEIQEWYTSVSHKYLIS